jgi:purine nucleosidase
MIYSKIPDEKMIKRLLPPNGKIRMVLDTDTFNEVDDQFALVYALRSSDRLKVESVYAAPFHNELTTSAGDGMEKSYKEILNILDLVDLPYQDLVYRGSTGFLDNLERPRTSEAATDLVSRAMDTNGDEPLYVVAIGAITNIASAILLEPKIIERITIIWLGGHSLNWPDNREFNLIQDVTAARVIFDCGVPLIHIPCNGVTSHLHTTIPELEYYLKGKSRIADYLISIVKDYQGNPFGWSKIIWDIAPIAWLICNEWVSSNIIHSPILTENATWSFDDSRHFMRYVYFMQRDQIFSDLFRKLSIQ